MAAIDPFNKKYLLSCKGYDPKFIDPKTPVTLDVLTAAHKKHLPDVEGNKDKLLNYTNLSVWYHKKRKVPFVSAYNIDGTLKRKLDRASSFKPDPRIDEKTQLGQKKFYDLVTDFTEFEIGHMASHNEMAWGSVIDSKVRSFQTFHFTNSVPQVEKLNSGLWSKLESYVINETKESGTKKISVFTGPMLKDNDPKYNYDKTFQVPLFFYKIVVFSHNKKLYATAFVMSQYKRSLELDLIPASAKPAARAFGAPTDPFMDYKHREVFQVNLDMIESYTGLNFKWPKVERVIIPKQQKKLVEIAETGGTGKPVKRAFGAAGTASGATKTNMVLPGK